MRPFYAETENFIESEKTFISADVAAEATSVSVDNGDGFELNDYVVIGTQGYEKSEIKKITGTPTSTTLTLEALSFAHKKNEPITKIAFNQRRFYGSDAEGGTYTLIETKTIEVDNPQGTYFSYTGEDYSWFKATYYNSQTGTETDIDDSVAVEAGEATRYCSVYDIREEAGFLNNPYVSDGRINLLILQAESEVKGSVGSRYKLPLSEIPDIIKSATIMIAAGRLLYREYGYDTEGLAKDGIEKIKEGRSILKAIRNGEIKLFDSSDTELDHVTTAAASYWPDDTTEDAKDDDAGGSVQFRISKNF